MPLEYLKERLSIARLLIDISKIYHAGLFGEGANFAASIDAVFVMCCVVIGHAENRPMNATKISHYLNMARTTALRKLDDLEHRGSIVRKGTVYFVSPRQSHDLKHVERIHQLIRSFCAQLSD